MNVAGSGIDVGVPEQGLHHRQVDAGLGQHGAEGVPQRVWMSTGDSGDLPVVPEDRAQARRSQPLEGVSLSV